MFKNSQFSTYFINRLLIYLKNFFYKFARLTKEFKSFGILSLSKAIYIMLNNINWYTTVTKFV